MENICDLCKQNPRSHSFTLLSDYIYNGINGKLFYTKIADGELYNDTDGILSNKIAKIANSIYKLNINFI